MTRGSGTEAGAWRDPVEDRNANDTKSRQC